MKRILVISDPHCGHKFGLTPPRWQKQCGKEAKFAATMWGEFTHRINRVAPYSHIFLMGDLIDGRGEKSGGTELITSDRSEQCDIFKDVYTHLLLKSGSRKVKSIAVFGTGYHTSSGGEDWEQQIADTVECKIGSHEWPEIEGVIFDIKHHTGRSAVPWSQLTGIQRDAAWGELWHVRQQRQPLASVYLRGHVHYFKYGGDAYKLCVTLPCLTFNSKFGARRCSEAIDWGFTWFDVDKGKLIDWGAEIVCNEMQKGKVTRL